MLPPALYPMMRKKRRTLVAMELRDAPWCGRSYEKIWYLSRIGSHLRGTRRTLREDSHPLGLKQFERYVPRLPPKGTSDSCQAAFMRSWPAADFDPGPEEKHHEAKHG